MQDLIRGIKKIIGADQPQIIKKETVVVQHGGGFGNSNALIKHGLYMLAQLLSDDLHILLRVSLFEGETKASPLFSGREFGDNCLFYSLDDLLRYGDVLNMGLHSGRNAWVLFAGKIGLIVILQIDYHV